MIAAYVLAFLPLVWPVPIQSKPRPPQPALQRVVDMELTQPIAGAVLQIGTMHTTSGPVTNLEYRPIRVLVVDMFTDECAHDGVYVREFTLGPYETKTFTSFLVTENDCPGWGIIERAVLADGQMALRFNGCSGHAPCGARIDVPVYVVVPSVQP